MKILVFGNPLLEFDSLPIKLMPKLQKLFPEIELEEIDPTEGLEKKGRNLFILDTAKDIEEVMEINSIEQLQSSRIYSMHDFDLAYNLKILKKLNLIDSVKIACVPMNISEEEALNQIQLIFKKWAAQLIQGS